MRRRRPGRVYDVGDEPDPRFSLANERTFLAWVRTALALVAGSVALHSLAVPDPRWLRSIIVAGLAILGSLTVINGYVRWSRVEQAMRKGEPLPGLSTGLATAVALATVGIVLAFVLGFG